MGSKDDQLDFALTEKNMLENQMKSLTQRHAQLEHVLGSASEEQQSSLMELAELQHQRNLLAEQLREQEALKAALTAQHRQAESRGKRQLHPGEREVPGAGSGDGGARGGEARENSREGDQRRVRTDTHRVDEIVKEITRYKQLGAQMISSAQEGPMSSEVEQSVQLAREVISRFNELQASFLTLRAAMEECNRAVGGRAASEGFESILAFGGDLEQNFEAAKRCFISTTKLLLMAVERQRQGSPAGPTARAESLQDDIVSRPMRGREVPPQQQTVPPPRPTRPPESKSKSPAAVSPGGIGGELRRQAWPAAPTLGDDDMGGLRGEMALLRRLYESSGQMVGGGGQEESEEEEEEEEDGPVQMASLAREQDEVRQLLEQRNELQQQLMKIKKAKEYAAAATEELFRQGGGTMAMLTQALQNDGSGLGQTPGLSRNEMSLEQEEEEEEGEDDSEDGQPGRGEGGAYASEKPLNPDLALLPELQGRIAELNDKKRELGRLRGLLDLLRTEAQGAVEADGEEAQGLASTEEGERTALGHVHLGLGEGWSRLDEDDDDEREPRRDTTESSAPRQVNGVVSRSLMPPSSQSQQQRSGGKPLRDTVTFQEPVATFIANDELYENMREARMWREEMRGQGQVNGVRHGGGGVVVRGSRGAGGANSGALDTASQDRTTAATWGSSSAGDLDMVSSNLSDCANGTQGTARSRDADRVEDRRFESLQSQMDSLTNMCRQMMMDQSNLINHLNGGGTALHLGQTPTSGSSLVPYGPPGQTGASNGPGSPLEAETLSAVQSCSARVAQLQSHMWAMQQQVCMLASLNFPGPQGPTNFPPAPSMPPYGSEPYSWPYPGGAPLPYGMYPGANPWLVSAQMANQQQTSPPTSSRRPPRQRTRHVVGGSHSPMYHVSPRAWDPQSPSLD